MTTESIATGKRSYPKAVAALSSSTGDTWVLVPDKDDGMVAVVDDTGHEVWKLCDGTRTPDQIANIASQHMGNPVTGVSEFIEQLHSAGLVISQE